MHSTVHQLVPTFDTVPTRKPSEVMTASWTAMPQSVPLLRVKDRVQLEELRSRMVADSSSHFSSWGRRFKSSRSRLFSALSASA